MAGGCVLQRSGGCAGRALSLSRWAAALVLMALVFAPLHHAGAHGVAEALERRLADVESVPDDPAVLTGTLENGLTYYIRENREPRDRAVMRLVVNAGSVLEDEDQLGLAHFVEHMAFRGTESFEREEIIGFLEEVGMEYGPHVNAYVSFDETVYMMRLPTDEEEIFDRGLDILSEWAHRIEFDPERVDHERDVIEEEWRVRLGSAQRVRDEQLPVILHDSRYAERLPIGAMDIVRNAPPETLERFYDEWYRPENMAVVAVGDFDADTVRAAVDRFFGRIPPAGPDFERPSYEVPEHDDTLFAIAEDPELSHSSVTVYNKAPFEPIETTVDYRRYLIDRLFREMLNTRLRRIARGSEPPFVQASAGVSRIGRPLAVSYLWAAVDEEQPDGAERGLSAIVREARRAQQHGFSEEELDRARRTLLREVEREYRQRDEIRSDELAPRYVDAFLDGSPFPSAETRLEYAQEMLPEISAREVREAAARYLAGENRVVTVSMIETGERELPREVQLGTLLDDAATAETEPYEEDMPAADLAVSFPERGEIVEEIHHEEVSVHEWRLSNGATVLVRPTDFRSDDVRFTAYSLGGTSLVEEGQLVSARLASNLIWESGVGAHSRSDLEDILAGLDVELRPYIDRTDHGFHGSSGTDEVEQLLQLLALYLTDPREDEEAFDTVRRNVRTQLQNQEADPQFQWSKRMTELLWDENPRVMPLTSDQLGQFDMAAAHEVFGRLFSDPGRFTFTFVGDIDPAAVRPLVEEYLAAIPGERMAGEVIDRGARYGSGVRRDVVEAGMAPQSFVGLVFHGDLTYSRESNYLLRSLGEVVRRRMQEYLREELGAVYTSFASGTPVQRPWERYALQLVFATDPEESEELAELVLAELQRIRDGELDEQYVSRTREVQRSNYEEGLRENSFWLQNLVSLHKAGRDFTEILDYPELVDGLTREAAIEAAGRYIDPGNFAQVILMPGVQQE